jgi:hypothetical protein
MAGSFLGRQYGMGLFNAGWGNQKGPITAQFVKWATLLGWSARLAGLLETGRQMRFGAARA